MTEKQLTAAREFADTQFLSGAIDANKYLDLQDTLRNDPEEFWNVALDDPDNPIRHEAEQIVRGYGPELTFGGLRRLVTGEGQQPDRRHRKTRRASRVRQ